MYNSDTIVLNECMHTAGRVHIYYSEETKSWQAFGLSAYILCQFACGKKMGRAAGYSFQLMMPEVCISDSDLKTLKSECDSYEAESPLHLILSQQTYLDRDGYRQWARRLRESANGKLLQTQNRSK